MIAHFKKQLVICLSILALSLTLTGCSANGQASGSSTKQNSGQTQSTTGKHKAKNKAKKSFVSKALLNFLKITKQDFSSEKKSGKSIVDIAKEKNITEQQLEDFLVNQRLQQLKSKHKNLSADQLAKKKTQLTKTIKKQIERRKQPSQQA